MQIRVPLSDDRNHSLTMLVIYLPDGTQVKVKTGKPVYDFKLPAGVGEDEIDVYFIFLGQDQKPAYGCGPVCIKRATKVTVAESLPKPAAEAGSPSIEATEPPAITPTYVETEAAALHTVTNHANDKHDAGTTIVSEPAAATSASAADVSARRRCSRCRSRRNSRCRCRRRCHFRARRPCRGARHPGRGARCYRGRTRTRIRFRVRRARPRCFRHRLAGGCEAGEVHRQTYVERKYRAVRADV